jgi:hypothetical protein
MGSLSVYVSSMMGPALLPDFLNAFRKKRVNSLSKLKDKGGGVECVSTGELKNRHF